MRLPVTKIQRFCTHDGPGIRTTVFLKGCPLHCVWCHNPETQSAKPEFFHAPLFCVGCGACVSVCSEGVHSLDDRHSINRERCTGCMACTAACPSGALEACAQLMTGEQIMAEVMKDSVFYGSNGGLTLSGGEPLLHGEAIVPLLRAARASRLTTVVETCGIFDVNLLDTIVPLTDLFLWDVKDTDSARHRANTGGALETVLSNLRKADALGAKTRLRCILMQDVNLNHQHLSAVAALFYTLRHCEGVELIPYHTYGDAKNQQLGRASAAHPEWIPSAEQMNDARAFISQHAVLIPG